MLPAYGKQLVFRLGKPLNQFSIKTIGREAFITWMMRSRRSLRAGHASAQCYRSPIARETGQQPDWRKADPGRRIIRTAYWLETFRIIQIADATSQWQMWPCGNTRPASSARHRRDSRWRRSTKEVNSRRRASSRTNAGCSGLGRTPPEPAIGGDRRDGLPGGGVEFAPANPPSAMCTNSRSRH